MIIELPQQLTYDGGTVVGWKSYCCIDVPADQIPVIIQQLKIIEKLQLFHRVNCGRSRIPEVGVLQKTLDFLNSNEV